MCNVTRNEQGSLLINFWLHIILLNDSFVSWMLINCSLLAAAMGMQHHIAVSEISFCHLIGSTIYIVGSELQILTQ